MLRAFVRFSTILAVTISGPGPLLSLASAEGLAITDLGAQLRTPERFWLPNRRFRRTASSARAILGRNSTILEDSFERQSDICVLEV